MDFGIVLAGAAAVNRFVEFVKPAVRKLPWAVEIQDALLVLIAVLAGVVVSLVGTLNLFVGFGRIPEVVGILLTGGLIGIGADALNAIIDLLYGWRDAQRVKSIVK